MRPPGDILHITPRSGPWPLHDAAASRSVEQVALAAHAPHVLMALAGLAVARLALALAPHAARIRVWAGPGNNGGDGLVAARHLHQAGKAVSVDFIGDSARLPFDAAQAWREAIAAGVPIATATWGPDAGPPPDLVIDALLGIGSTRAPAGAMAQAVAAMNAGTAPVLAVDIPTGLHPDSGAPLGEAAVRATATLALLTLKPGCFTGQGRDFAGDVWLAPLGVTTADGATARLIGAPANVPRPHASHKGSQGDVAVVGGAAGMAGAAWLAARAALAAGAGRVYCSLLDEDAAGLDPLRPELMARARWWASPPAVLAQATVACGCGGGEAIHAALPLLLQHAGRLLLDADGLNALAADAALQAALRTRAGRGLPTLLTPHPLEAARLLNATVAAVQRDRLAAARELAARLAATVLLKGSGSVIVAPGESPWINPTGNAALATAGSGDVLAGWAAGLWAQQPAASAREIAVMAAWQHGNAADRHAPAARGAPLRASDLVEALAAR
ncbi:ADP-dependent (S)-NAD(P)H-hydrate dehydratase,NAD(P)H-hydrate epimerase [Rubrivivax sp. A210]|uniref:NAD(P)H-hydrate dehydratase n=1 Tax=Rubrivivax sp. A210 TaxID=2772301 RepID=UPI00191A74BC|nr:NAD(P)H-hydrate dehydratase [Rubrivivax sp. A210]CAD5367304.1 ADP-dependent (S)-NAD(P)H-hydrate dehydratase,NAD(P)H-hydrate epimerase [Rubrivivax sp. A210]